MRKTIVTVLAAVAAMGAIGAPAHAAEEAVTVEVSYADLNLATEAGTAALSRRIEAAVDAVCAKPASRDLKRAVTWQKCRSDALAGARAAMAHSETLRPVQVALKL